jgi:hypothetical protein
MLQLYALSGQWEDVLPFVLHIDRGLSDNGSWDILVSVRIINPMQNHFESLDTLENLQICEILWQGHQIGIINEDHI